MALLIDELKRNALRRWYDAAPGIPRSRTHFSTESQTQRELELDRRLDDLDESVHVCRSTRVDARRRIQQSIVQLLHSFDCMIDEDVEASFSQVMDDFIHRVYDFDPAIPQESIYQASRNVSIMNTFQMHLSKRIVLTPSIFAYSMLYPYTDNHIDSPGVSPSQKDNAIERLQLRLRGSSITPRDPRERMICDLVALIEAEFDRGTHPLVYESLLAIHSAQAKSVAHQSYALSPDRLLDISAEKGGLSVLADGYLVAGDVSRVDAEFFFQFGVCLQLIDDLQDLHEDFLNRQRTLAFEAAVSGHLEDFTNRLLSYTASVLKTVDNGSQKVRNLIERSCRLLIYEAIASHWYYYNPEYLAIMETSSPVRFNHLRATAKRIQGYKNHPDITRVVTKSKYRMSESKAVSFVA